MNWKTTVTLLVLVVGLGAYLKFYEMKQPDTAEALRQSQKVVKFNQDKIDGIMIQNGDETIHLRRQDNKWRLETPIKDQADPSLVQNLFSDLEDWEKEATISGKEIEADKSKLAEYGLTRPKLRLKLDGPNAPPEIFFGKDAALEGKMYVRLENSKETFVVPKTVKKDIEKKPDEFRDRKLTDLSPAQVTRVVLKTNAGEMELQKKNDHWEVTTPLRARADDRKINDLIAQVTNARIEQFVAGDQGDLHAYGLAEPRGSVTLFGADDKQGKMLQIGNIPDKQKDQVYVRFASRGFVYTLPKKIEEILSAKPDDLRDRHLIRIDTNILDRIAIEPTGKTRTVLARKGENWTIVNLKNAPANSSEVQRLIQILQNEQVAKFVENVASNLARYGLDKPQLQLTFSSFASENTAETKAGERPFATLAFGKVEGDTVYARVGEEPFVVAVDRALLDQIFTDPLQWQELSIFNFKPEQIHRFTFASNKEELSMQRAENKQWQLLNGNGSVNQTNVQSLINTVANLHAVRWAGTTGPQQGLEKPQLTFTFTVGPDQKDSHILKIGAHTPDGMWFANVEGREGTFEISNPDFDALKLPLVSQASPSPTPIPSPSSTATPVTK